MSSHCFLKHIPHTHLFIFNAYLRIFTYEIRSAPSEGDCSNRCGYEVLNEGVITSPAFGSTETPEGFMNRALMETELRLNTNKP